MARTPHERDAEKRASRLADIKEQVEDGRLSIRQMTDEERERHQPRPRKESRPRSKRKNDR
jgi:hypothetical protein